MTLIQTARIPGSHEASTSPDCPFYYRAIDVASGATIEFAAVVTIGDRDISASGLAASVELAKGLSDYRGA